MKNHLLRSSAGGALATTVRIALSAILLATPTYAQESANFRLTERDLNGGGVPREDTVLGSAHFQITLASIGNPASVHSLTSPSLLMDVNFASSFPPPDEVSGVVFATSQTLIWNPERSAGAYNLYRDLNTELKFLQYGTCVPQDLAEPSTQDTDIPPHGEGYFYLVTAKNLLHEEGIKGVDSSGILRPNAEPCP